MTTKKKLIEVALPLEAINAACKADKDRKTGTIRNLHKWFAPMPVPALRALIFASLVDDPEDDAERQRLLRLIEDLVASVVDNPPARVLEEAKREIRKSVGELPTVLDPFCGGGSTLVEAQRLGLPSRGSDLNPIPVLISKVLTELPPTVVGRPPINNPGSRTTWSGLEGFLADVAHYAEVVRDAAWLELGHLYPVAPNGDPVIAWWWATTVDSPDPRYQGRKTPLVTNWWLSKQKGRLAYLEPTVNGEVLSFTIKSTGKPVPPSKDRCLFSGEPITFDYLRLVANDAGLGKQMLALISHGQAGRDHFVPDDVHLAAAAVNGDGVVLPALPDAALGFRVQGYGMQSWSDLFLPRQLVMLSCFSRVVAGLPARIRQDGGSDDQVRFLTSFLALCLGKLVQFSSTQCLWKLDSRNGSGKAESAKFGRNDVTMTWDYVETNPFGGSVGDWNQIVETALRALKYVEPGGPKSTVLQGDARTAGAGMTNQALIVTDPPYFSAIGYANLSDYFYPWIRQTVREIYPDLFATVATPKSGELIAEPARHATKEEAKDYFINGFTDVFSNLRHVGNADLPIVVVYAYKEQEQEQEARVSSGWEAMLEAVIRSGYAIVGTWPIHGTGSTRMRGLKANALATYVAMVCRPRQTDLSRVSRRDFHAALRRELGPAIELLQQAAVAPVDMAQAVLGPGMAVFTRYEAVLEADGTTMTVRSALLLINSVLSEVRGEREGDFDAETRWAIEWFDQHRFENAPSGEAIALAQAKVTNLDSLERSGVIATKGGKTRLLSRDELSPDYDPRRDAHPTVWEGVQHMVRVFEAEGESGAAALYSQLAHVDAVRELAYALFAVCEKRSWAEEASAYNALVASWPEIARLAQRQSGVSDEAATRLPGM